MAEVDVPVTPKDTHTLVDIDDEDFGKSPRGQKTTIQKYLHIGIALIVGISLGGLIASLLHPGASHTGQIASFCSMGHDCFGTSAGKLTVRPSAPSSLPPGGPMVARGGNELALGFSGDVNFHPELTGGIAAPWGDLLPTLQSMDLFMINHESTVCSSLAHSAMIYNLFVRSRILCPIVPICSSSGAAVQQSRSSPTISQQSRNLTAVPQSQLTIPKHLWW